MWYPQAVKIPFNHADGGSYTGGPFRGVLHTTESYSYWPSRNSYYGHRNPPHFTLYLHPTAGPTVYQHFDTARAARALRNLSGGVQTNRRSAIQIEIVWKAANAGNLPKVMLDELSVLMGWIEQAHGVKHVSLPFAKSYAQANSTGFRLTPTQWDTFDGWLGHCKVPENTHWDPGLLDLGYVIGDDMFARYGDRNDKVEALQLLLIDAGYTLPQWGADGDFGNETKQALTAYQQHRSISETDSDGNPWYGPKTYAELTKGHQGDIGPRGPAGPQGPDGEPGPAPTTARFTGISFEYPD